MAEEAAKRCEQCNAEYVTNRPKQAKYCDFCAAANGVLHFKEKRRKCLACRGVFSLTTAHDILCSRCDNGISFCRATCRGKCHYCGTPDARLADKDIPVCFHCWKSPERRPDLIKNLALKRTQRIKENA